MFRGNDRKLKDCELTGRSANQPRGRAIRLPRSLVEDHVVMRAKSIKRLAILIVVLGLIGGTSFVAHGIQLAKMAQSVVKQAERAEKEGNFTEAEKLYREHLKVFPD